MFWKISFVPFLTIALLSQFACTNKYIIPSSPEQETLAFPRQSPLLQAELHQESEVLVWNIKKGIMDHFVNDFGKFSKEKDLILLQEFKDISHIKSAVLNPGTHEYILGASFMYRKDKTLTGVATGSVAPPVNTIYLRTPNLEPWFNTPKVTLCNTFMVKDFTKKLLVCNIHGLNFTEDEYFKDQLETIKPHLITHKGPILFGGDFNTNSECKLKFLHEVMEESGLEPVVFSPDDRTPTSNWFFWKPSLPLDHIFTRGLSVTEAKAWKDTEGSDHNALTITIRVLD